MIRAWTSLLVIEGVGAATLTLLCADAKRWGLTARLGLSFGLGLVSLSVWLFLASLAGLKPRWWLGIAELALLGAGVAAFRRGQVRGWIDRPDTGPRERGGRVLDWVLLVFVVGLVLLVGAVALAEPLVEWDALAIWGLKARVLWHEPIAGSPYFADLTRAYSHLDYPLLWPLAMAWVWAVVGRADLDVVKVLAPALLAAFAATGYGLLRRRHERTAALLFTALLVGLPMTLSQTARLSADAPLGYFAMATFYCWYLWLTEADADALRLSGVFAAGMLFTKSEGLGLFAVLLVLAGAVVARPWRATRALQAATWTLLVPLVLTAGWLTFRVGIPKVHEDYGARVGPAVFVANLGRVPEVLAQSVAYLGDVASWLLFWPLLAVALVVTQHRWWRRTPGFLVLAVVLPVLMYGYIYVVAPWKVDELMDLSANRLLFHVAPLAILLLAELRLTEDPGMIDWTAFDQKLASRRRPIVDGFEEFLRLESVSQAPAKVRATGEWLAALLRARGLEGRLLETGGNPAVFGERRVPGATRTVLIYCHYDTKPIPPRGWLQPNPLEPVYRRGLPETDAPLLTLADARDDDLDTLWLYARGAADDKGPIWCHLHALELMDALAIAPTVNVKLIFDGEEEIGSPFFGPFTEAHRELLAADLVIVTDGPKHGSGRPTVTGGARGVMKIELEIEAARRDVHSGNFTVPNPAWKLNGLLASMATPDGTPLIEGFEEDVVAPTADERRLMAEFPLDLPVLETELGVRLPTDYLDRLMFHPTLTIRGLHSGFVGAEANTIIPHKATVAIDIRMVKNQRWSKVYRRLLDHFRAQGFSVLESADAPLPDEQRGRTVRIVDKGGYDPAKTSLDLPISREVIAAVERAHPGQRAVLAPTAGGSVPIWAFTDILKLPTLLVPYANANNRQHSPNEHLRLDHLFQGVRTTAQLLTDLGRR